MKYKNYAKTSQIGSCRRFCANVCTRVFPAGGASLCFRDCLSCRRGLLGSTSQAKKKKKK